MKFREWEDFADEINEYGRYGYVKKVSLYNPFTKVNTMVMEHKVNFDRVELVLYPDDELYDADWDNEPYVRRETRSEKFMKEMPKLNISPKQDHRTREHRSDKYPEKPGTKKEQISDSDPKPKPKPHPPRKDPDK